MKILIILFISFFYSNTVSNGLFLFSPIISMPQEGVVFNTYLMDNNNDIVHTWESEYCVAHTPYLTQDTILVRPGRIYPPFFEAGGIGGIIQKYDWSGNIIWETLWANNQYQQHHDIEVLPNGNILFISYDRKTQEEVLELGKIAHNGDFWSETIFEIELIGTNDYNIVWKWSLFDHLIQDQNSELNNFEIISDNPHKFDINYMAQNDEGPLPPQFYNPDFLHLNAIDYNPTLDLIVFSSRKSSEIYIIDHSTTIEEARTDSGGTYNKGGGFLYRWGNPIIYDRGTIEDQKLFGPHAVNWVDGSINHLMIFNNGNLRPDGTYSSIEEIVTPLVENIGYFIDDIAPYGPNEYSWYYTDNESFSGIQSGAFRLDNGNTLITYTALSKIIEVSDDLEIVWEYNHPSNQSELLSRTSKYNIFSNGDINYDFIINILDVVNIVNLILYDYQYNHLGDLNDDSIIDILDIIGVINIILDN